MVLSMAIVIIETIIETIIDMIMKIIVIIFEFETITGFPNSTRKTIYDWFEVC